MIRNVIAAAAFSAIASTAALAAGPVLVDEANSPTVVYDRPSANIVGSADAIITGSPSQTDYVTRRVFRTQAPGMARSPAQIEVNSSN